MTSEKVYVGGAAGKAIGEVIRRIDELSERIDLLEREIRIDVVASVALSNALERRIAALECALAHPERHHTLSEGG